MLERIRLMQSTSEFRSLLTEIERDAALEDHQPSDKHPAEWVLLKLKKPDEQLKDVYERYYKYYSHISSTPASIYDQVGEENFVRSLIYSLDQKQFPLKIYSQLVLDSINKAVVHRVPAAHYYLATLYQTGIIVGEPNYLLAVDHYLQCLVIEIEKERSLRRMANKYVPRFHTASMAALLFLRKKCGLSHFIETEDLLSTTSGLQYTVELARWCKNISALERLISFGDRELRVKNPNFASAHEFYATAYQFSASPVFPLPRDPCWALQNTELSLAEWNDLLKPTNDLARLKLIELIFDCNVLVGFNSLLSIEKVLENPGKFLDSTVYIYCWYLMYQNFSEFVDIIFSEKERWKKLEIYHHFLKIILQFHNTNAPIAKDGKLSAEQYDELVKEIDEYNQHITDPKNKILLTDNIFVNDMTKVMILRDLLENKNYSKLSGFDNFKKFAQQYFDGAPEAVVAYDTSFLGLRQRHREEMAAQAAQSEQLIQTTRYGTTVAVTSS